MKIAVWHNLRSGGGKRALYDHVKGLVERGHVVECWCPPTADASYLPLSRIAVEHVRPLALPSPPKRALSPALAHARLLLRRLRALDDHVRLCAREIESGGFDIVFAGACVFVATPAIARHTTLPSAIFLGEPYRPLYEASPELPWRALPPMGRVSFRKCIRRVTDYANVRARRIQVREEATSAQAFTSILVNSFFSRESVIRAYGI